MTKRDWLHTVFGWVCAAFLVWLVIWFAQWQAQNCRDYWDRGLNAPAACYRTTCDAADIGCHP
jgi:hypothetical protein